MLEIIPIPAFNDNYIWVGVNHHAKQAFIVDPGEAPQVIRFLQQQAFTPVAVLVTHKHPDHTGGIREILDVYPDLPVYAHPTEKVPTTTHFVQEGDQITLPAFQHVFKVIDIPGHTLGHVAYAAPSILFTGDTLFGAGCGRVFEGTALQMEQSLNKLAAFPDGTLIYCGHEYTLANLRFAALVEPNNRAILERIKETEAMCADDRPTLPSTLGLEKQTNPFLRCHQKEVIARVEEYVGRKLPHSVDVFHELREWKNK